MIKKEGSFLTYKDYKLCYVKHGKAFFTTQRLKDQWGDDWNDAPYEHNAGEPYTGKGWKIFTVFFEADLNEPCDDYRNPYYSVEEINKKAIPWLSPYSSSEHNFKIWAGTTLRDFIDIIKIVGGEVYVPLSNSIITTLP